MSNCIGRVGDKTMWRDAARVAGRAALAPYWSAQLLTGAKSFIDNPLLGSPTLNAWGLHARRLQLAHGLARRRRQRIAHLVSAADRADFDRDGVVVKPGFLPQDVFDRVLEEVKAYRGAGRETIQGNAVTRRLPLDPGTLARLPSLRAMLRQPDWRGLLRYAGSYDAEPIHYLQTILSHAHPGPDDPQCDLHSDHVPPFGEGVAVPHARGRGRRSVHLCAWFPSLDPRAFGLGASPQRGDGR